MPTLRLVTGQWGLPLDVDLPGGGTLAVPQPQFRCLMRVPNSLLPKDAVIDTGAPFTYFPQAVWHPLRPGVDYEWLPFAAGARVPLSRIAGWQFSFRMARFLAPVTLLDYHTEIDRPAVIAAFATGNPPVFGGRQSLPPVIIGLWGGLLESGTIRTTPDPARGASRAKWPSRDAARRDHGSLFS